MSLFKKLAIGAAIGATAWFGGPAAVGAVKAATAGELAVGGLVAGGVASQMKAAQMPAKQASFQRKAQKQQTAIEIEKNKKTALQSIRQARIQSAAIAQGAFNSGATGSGEAGAMGSIKSQLSGALGFQSMESQAAKNTTSFMADASKAGSKAGTFEAAGNTFFNLANFYAPKV